MKRLLTSNWTLALLAIVLGLGTEAGVLAWRLSILEANTKASASPIPDRIAWDFLTPEITRLADELHARVDAVANREKELQAYELRLKAERAELEKMKRDLVAMRKEISETITEVQGSEQKNLKTLAATYSSLSPAAALAIFQKMDDAMVVKILSFMKPDPVGQILEEMARSKEGEGSLAARAAVLSNKLRLLRHVAVEDNNQAFP